MSKGVVPHPKNYRKVGVEEWMDAVERIYPGLKQTTREYARSLNKDGSSTAKSAMQKYLEQMEQACVRGMRGGKGEPIRMGALDYLELPIYLDDCQMLGSWQDVRQVYRVNPSFASEIAIDESCQIPVQILTQVPYPVVYVQLLYENRVVTEAIRPDSNGCLSECPIEKTYRHDGALICYENSCLNIKDFYRCHDVYADGSTRDFDSLCGCFTCNLPIAADGTLGDSLIRAKQSLISESYAKEMLGSLYLAYDIDEDKRDFETDIKLAYKSSFSLYDLRKDFLSRIIGTLLYICSTNADMEPMYAPSPIRTGKQVRRNDTEATVTAVGYREGRALEVARSAHERELKERDTIDLPKGTHRSPAPHWRRGYFGYRWCGSGEDRHPELRWVSPAAVNFNKDSRNETVTFHAVKPEVC